MKNMRGFKNQIEAKVIDTICDVSLKVFNANTTKCILSFGYEPKIDIHLLMDAQEQCNENL